MSLQNNFANYSFLTLLISMIFYWIGAAFSTNLKSESALATNLFFVSPRFDSPSPFGIRAANIAKYGSIISNILLGSLLLLRWKDSGHFPLSNLYESLMFLSWCFTGIHIFIENYTLFDIENNMKEKSILGNPQFIQLLGAITTPSALLTNAFATFTLPKDMQEIAPLVPALQSNWLIMHVTVMILSYAALIIGSLLSIAFLIITTTAKQPTTENRAKSAVPFGLTIGFAPEEQAVKAGAVPDSFSTRGPLSEPASFLKSEAFQPAVSEKKDGSSLSTNNEGPENGRVSWKELKQTASLLNDTSLLLLDEQKGKIGGLQDSRNLALTLDNLSYRVLGIGFPLLTIGILSGAVWANEAWGSYWSWDPKETWALLTWLVFAIYLHTRLSKGWEGKRPAIIASIGFIIVWMCYLGVNLIGEGLHSYGWLS